MLADRLPDGERGHGQLHVDFPSLLRQRGWAQVLVTDQVRQLLLPDRVDPEMVSERVDQYGRPGLLEDIQDAVAHAEVRAHRAGHLPSLGGEDVGGRSPDIDRENPLIEVPGGERKDIAERGRRGPNGSAYPTEKFFVPRGLRHDMPHEEVVNRLPGGLQIFAIALRTDIVDRMEEETLVEHIGDIGSSIHVAGKEDREFSGRGQLRTQTRLPDQLGQKDRSG